MWSSRHPHAAETCPLSVWVSFHRQALCCIPGNALFSNLCFSGKPEQILKQETNSSPNICKWSLAIPLLCPKGSCFCHRETLVGRGPWGQRGRVGDLLSPLDLLFFCSTFSASARICFLHRPVTAQSYSGPGLLPSRAVGEAYTPRDAGLLRTRAARSIC